MVCKAVLTFLVIGALSVNVSTIPISRKPSPVQSTSEVDTPMSMPLTPPYSNTNTNPGTPILPSDKIFRKPESSPLAGHDSPNVLSTSGGAPGAPNPSTDPKASPDPNTPNDPKTSKGWGEFSRKTGEILIPGLLTSAFSGIITHKVYATKTNSTSNTRRDLGPDPPNLHIAARSLMDDHSRAPSHRPVPPKPQSQSESDDSDHSASIAVSKRGSVSEDEVADLPSSLLKRVPEPDPLRHSRPCAHPHGQAPGTPGPPRFKCEPRDWEEWGTNVGDRYANKYGPPDDAHH